MAGHLQLTTDMGVDLDDASAIGRLYESLLANWKDAAPDTRTDPNVLINALGTAFGEHLARRNPMRWVVAIDVYGTKLAVHDSATDLLIYPANAIAKRWTNGESGDFIVLMSDDIAKRAGR